METYYNIFRIFNHREQALFIWLLAIFVLALKDRKIRYSLKDLLKIFLDLKIQAPLLIMLAYVFCLSLLLREINLWDFSLLKDTIFWAFGTAFILMVNANKANEEAHYFRKVLLDNLKLILVLEFIVTLYTFRLWIELILVPVLLIIVVFNATAETKEKYEPVKKLTDGMLLVFGLIVLAYSAVKIYTDFDRFATTENLRAFLLPIILTLAFIPFLFSFTLYIDYDTLFTRVDYFIKEDKKLARYAKWKVFRLCHFNLKRLNKFSNEQIINFVTLRDKESILDLIQSFKK